MGCGYLNGMTNFLTQTQWSLGVDEVSSFLYTHISNQLIVGICQQVHTQEGVWQQYEYKEESRSRDGVSGFVLKAINLTGRTGKKSSSNTGENEFWERRLYDRLAHNLMEK